MRWLREDAIRPWQCRSWIFPTDPDFAQKAGRILDLYQGRWDGKLLEPGDCIISADEKPSIQARRRVCETLPPAAGVRRGQRVEHTYKRGGALTYLAAWDVRRGRVFGRTESKGGIAPFDRLVHQIMTTEPYASARRVFWIVDNGSSHRGKKSVRRLQARWPNLILVHTPVHASWVNQIEMFFGVVARRCLRRKSFRSTDELAAHLLAKALSPNGRVRLGIEAPKQVRIDRKEVLERIREENVDSANATPELTVDAAAWAAYGARRANARAKPLRAAAALVLRSGRRRSLRERGDRRAGNLGQQR